MKKLIAMGLVSAFAVASHAAVVEYWDFENATTALASGGIPSDGLKFNDNVADGGFGTTGTLGVNGTLIRGWDAGGATFTSDTSLYGGSYGMHSANQDGYVNNDGNSLVGWTSSDWTLELAVRIDDADNWETLVARMGSTLGGNEGDFYFQRKGIDANELRINYVSADGATRQIVDGATTLNAGQWYGLAVVVDSDIAGGNGSISLYLDQGSGYALDGQATGLAGDLGIVSTTFDWAFFRDYWGGGADNTEGTMDNVRFSDTALGVGDLMVSIPEPATIGLFGLAGAGVLFIRRRFMI